MPAKSQKQQQAAGIAYEASQEGRQLPPGTPAGQMQQMNVKDLKKYASTKHKGLPKRKGKKKAC